MTAPAKLVSLRTFVLAFIGLVLIGFAAILFAFFHAQMPKMLLEAENQYLNKQIEVVEGMLDTAVYRTYLQADDIAVGEHAVDFILGRDPGYIESHWPDTSPLQVFQQNFIIFKDLDNNDIYQEYHDYTTNNPLQVPAGLSRYLNRIGNAVLQKYKEAPDLSQFSLPEPSQVHGGLLDTGFGMSGIIFYQGLPYSVACLPIIGNRDSWEPAGVLFLGSELNNEYFKALTHYNSSTFELLNYYDFALEGKAAIHLLGDDTVYTEIQLRDLDDTPIIMRVSDTRQIYSAGTRTLWQVNMLLVLLMGVFALAVYLALTRLVLRPIEKLSQDIGGIKNSGELETLKYSRTREFATLCSAINGMLERLKQSQVSIDVFHSILNGMDSFIYLTDPETGQILFVNNKLREEYGLDGDIIGRPCWEVIQGIDERCGFCRVPALLRAPGEVITWENRNIRNGRYFRNVDRFIDWPGRDQVHLQQATDITQVRESEIAVKRRLEQQELMAAMSQRFISNSDTASLINDALSMAGEFMNVGKIIVGRHDADSRTLKILYEWFNPARTGLTACPDIPFTEKDPEYATLVERGEPFFCCGAAGDVRTLPVDGILCYIFVPILVDGAFWGVIGFGETAAERDWTESDITLAMLIGSVISAGVARGELEESLLRMSAIVNNSPQAIMYINMSGRFEYLNQGTLDLLGYGAQELMDGGLARIVDEKTYRVLRGEIIPHVIHGLKNNFELTVLKKDGAKRLMSFSAFKADTTSMGIGVIASDITERRAMEKELIAARDQAEQSSKAKGEFLSRMSHEMRTPMNAIIGMTNIAKSSNDADKKEYCLDKIEDASHHLLGVINDILDMSKIEANKFELSFTEFNFEKMLLRVLNVINFRVEEKKQNLIVKVDPAMPRFVISDEQRLAQVIANLLSNAVKFTPDEGTVSLSVKVLEESEGGCSVQISVADTGIGISPDQQRRLFRSFEQADGGISRKFGGTGLGLVISKSIVELLNGRIWVESIIDRGATFSFIVPVRKGENARQSLFSPDVNWSDLRLLAVDDAPDVLEFFEAFAANIGVECALAASGEEALSILADNEGKNFNLLFVDWKMPGMDGLELTRKIRALHGDGGEGTGKAADRVVIMISGAEWSDIESEARQAGVDRFVAKPLFASTLVDCINQCLGLERYELSPAQGAQAAGPGGGDMAGCFSGRRILLAEDIAINSEIVITLLEDTGINIDCAQNGLEALDKFRSNPGMYDLILMDIHMPEVDGYEATRRIRALRTKEAENIPIVAMTANVFREDIEKCLAAGMNDHIGKPVDLGEIMAKLLKWLPEK